MKRKKYPQKSIFILEDVNSWHSEKLSKDITTVPVHPGLTKKELDYIVKIINKF